MQRSAHRSTLLIILGIVAAFVLGSVGTAVAGPAITRAKVKSIATKVVKKQAPALSVAYASYAGNAGNAGNATLLNALPASSYQNQSYRFRLPQGGAAVGSNTWSFEGMPAGNYLATYTVISLATTATGALACYMKSSAASTVSEAFSIANAVNNNAAVTGSALLQLTGAAARLTCNAPSDTFSIYSSAFFLSGVTFTRVDSLTDGTTSRGVDSGRAGPSSN